MEGKLLENEIRIEMSSGEGCERVASVEICRERFEDEKSRVLREIAREVTIPGFRKGKAPEDLVQRRYADEIHAEAIKSILPIAYRHVVTSENLDPLGDPEFHEVSAPADKPLTFQVRVEVMPAIEIAGYRDVAVPLEEIPVTDEEVEEVIASLRERSADYVAVERAAAEGDVATIDFAPIGPDGAPNEKQRTKQYPVQLGAGQIFPAFETAIVGTKAGETGRVSIEYPADFKPERIAGKSVDYEFTVVDVREKKLPELDDAFAQRLEDRLKTLADLRADVRERLAAEKGREARHRREERAIDLLIERNPFAIPRTMRERFKKELYAEEERRRQAVGVGPEEDAGRRAEMEQLFDRVADRNIKRYFVMEHVAAKERIEISSEDLEKEYAALAAQGGRSVEDVRKLFTADPERVANLTSRLRERRIFEIILGAA